MVLQSAAIIEDQHDRILLFYVPSGIYVSSEAWPTTSLNRFFVAHHFKLSYPSSYISINLRGANNIPSAVNRHFNRLLYVHS